MLVSVQAVDRLSGEVIASIQSVDVPKKAQASPFALAKAVKGKFTAAGLLSSAQAACALFVLCAL